jgi:large subunit ribosomal protein L17
MVQSLIEHGEIRTTLPKAKEMRPFAEHLINMAVRAAAAREDAALPEDERKLQVLALRRQAESVLTDRSIIPQDHQKEYDAMSDAKRDKHLRSRSGRRYRSNVTRRGLKWTAESVIHKLFGEIGPSMHRRNQSRSCSGGYTRIIKLADRRLGDGGRLAILQIVGESDEPRPKLAEKTERKRRARVKYLVYAGKERPKNVSRRRTPRAARPADVQAAPAPHEASAGESKE